MTKNNKELTEKLTRLGYPDFEIQPGAEDVPLLLISGRLICGVGFALDLPDDALKALIDETVQVEEVQG